jgi:hypothetical protein
MRIHQRFLYGLFVALALIALPAFCQSTTAGDIAGIVTDPSGAAVPNASVALKSLSNGSTQTATTNAQGYYRFALLAPGQYSVQ